MDLTSVDEEVAPAALVARHVVQNVAVRHACRPNRGSDAEERLQCHDKPLLTHDWVLGYSLTLR
jgi:hypothetical protein